MKKYIFGIPIFETKVDLKRLKIPRAEVQPTWDSGVRTTLSTQLEIHPTSLQYLCDIITDNLEPANLMGTNPSLGHIWRNLYGEHDYQDPHTHPGSQWSFIIYETMASKTAFFNPSMNLIQTQMGFNVHDFPSDYKPDLKPGSMIIFPSFLMHMVHKGNKGTTISGNIHMEYE